MFQIILLLLLSILRKRIGFMAALFKESAKCLAELPGLFFQPLLTFAALILFFAFWVTVILCLATASKCFDLPIEFRDKSINYISTSVADYPGTKPVQMYKNHIFDALNLSSIGGKVALVEEKKFDFSLESFKSNRISTFLLKIFNP